MWGLEGRVGFCLDVFLFFELEGDGERKGRGIWEICLGVMII